MLRPAGIAKRARDGSDGASCTECILPFGSAQMQAVGTTDLTCAHHQRQHAAGHLHALQQSAGCFCLLKQVQHMTGCKRFKAAAA